MVAERLTYDFPDACTIIGIGQTKGRELVKAGVIPSIRFGRRVVIARHVVDMILAGEIDLSAADDDNRAAQSR